MPLGQGRQNRPAPSSYSNHCPQSKTRQPCRRCVLCVEAVPASDGGCSPGGLQLVGSRLLKCCRCCSCYVVSLFLVLMSNQPRLPHYNVGVVQPHMWSATFPASCVSLTRANRTSHAPSDPRGARSVTEHSVPAVPCIAKPWSWAYWVQLFALHNNLRHNTLPNTDMVLGRQVPDCQGVGTVATARPTHKGGHAADCSPHCTCQYCC